MVYSEKKTATTTLAFEKFDSNAAKIQRLKKKREKLMKELEAVDAELKNLEVDPSPSRPSSFENRVGRDAFERSRINLKVIVHH